MSASIRSVLQVGTSDRAGGAERVMMDLHAEYRRRGLDSRVAVGFKRSTEPEVVEIPNAAARSAWARTLGTTASRIAGNTSEGPRRMLARALLLLSDPSRYRAVLAGHEDMGYPATSRLLELAPQLPDVLHLHNLHGGYFDLRALPGLAQQVPTLITMHDAWLLTGHCAHPFDCPGWREGCESCPHLDIPIRIRRDAAAENLQMKREALARTSAALVSPSEWLMRLADTAGILSGGRLSRVIPNGVDTNVYSPGDRLRARAELGLPAEAEIVLFAGQSLHRNPYKDFPTLAAALPAIVSERGDSLLLVALGSESDSTLRGLPIAHLPFVEDPGRVATYLRAADVYAHPARAENLPLVIIEAMACGTPVVASRVGGIPELVAHGQTGLLVEPGDASGFAQAVVRLLGDPPLRSRLAEAAHSAVLERHTLAGQADAYLAFYAEVAEDRARRKRDAAVRKER